jgi:hypothetical protein
VTPRSLCAATVCIAAVCAASPDAATKYLEIDPGWSTKADAVRALGEPVFVMGDILLEHKPQEGTGPIFVELRLTGGDIVERVEVRFAGAVDRASVISGLKLPAAPAASRLDRNGKLLEFFGEGAALMVGYGGPDASAGAVAITYYSDVEFARQTGLAEIASKTNPPPGPGTPKTPGTPGTVPGPPAPPVTLLNTVPPSVKRDPLACYNLYTWSQVEEEAARKARQTPRRQLAMEIRINAQAGDCEKAKALTDQYKRLYPGKDRP